jgi:hypothetical protein
MQDSSPRRYSSGLERGKSRDAAVVVNDPAALSLDPG